MEKLIFEPTTMSTDPVILREYSRLRQQTAIESQSVYMSGQFPNNNEWYMPLEPVEEQGQQLQALSFQDKSRYHILQLPRDRTLQYIRCGGRAM